MLVAALLPGLILPLSSGDQPRLAPALPPAPEPRILSCIAGYYRCFGVPNVADLHAWGCDIGNATDCSGRAIPPRPQPPLGLALACRGQQLHNTTGQDGTPVTFSLPVDIASVSAAHFRWLFADGSTRAPGCVIHGGAPANEPNELQTLALLGDAGGWSGPTPGSGPMAAVGLEVVGPLMLVAPNGSKVSAQGLSYRGPAMDYANGIFLLSAEFQTFTTAGETLGGGVYPNHCRVLFPKTTHRLRLLFDGGVTIDGHRPITPDRTDLFQLLDSRGVSLPSGVVLGLADLGTAPAPVKQCEKDTWAHDHDNYLDVCLDMSWYKLPPAQVHVLCGEATQISAPKGVRYPCKPHTVAVTAAQPASATPHTTPTKSDDGVAPAPQLCARQMAADGCLDGHGAPEGGAHKCGECATAHNKDLLARNCTYELCKALCEKHQPKPPAPAPAPANPGDCRANLTKQVSTHTKCIAGDTFGCTNSSKAMWSAAGCRGLFSCGGATGVECDSSDNKASPEHNQTCPCKKSKPKPPPPPTPCFTENNTVFPCVAPCFCQDRWNSSQINSTDHIRYSSVYNLSLHLWQPPTSDTRLKRPAAVGIHGGGFETGNRNTDAFVQTWARKLAQRGFVTVSIDYRLYGLKPTTKNPGGAETSNTDAMYDAKAAVRWLRKNAAELRIDTERIAAFGCSAGAMTTAFLCGVGDTKGEGTSGNPGFSSDIQAGVALSGALIELNYLNVGLNKNITPYLDFHGCKDHTVPYFCPTGKKALECWGSGVDTVEHMNRRKPGVASLFSIPGAGHCPHGDVERGPAAESMMGFLSERLDLKNAECPK